MLTQKPGCGDLVPKSHMWKNVSKGVKKLRGTRRPKRLRSESPGPKRLGLKFTRHTSRKDKKMMDFKAMRAHKAHAQK